MLTRMKIVDPADRTGMMAMIRDVRNEAVKMTPEEKAAFDRIVGSDHNSKQFKDYVKNRDVDPQRCSTRPTRTVRTYLSCGTATTSSRRSTTVRPTPGVEVQADGPPSPAT